MNAPRSGDVGSTLRAARERKGVTLRQIADKTKISVTVLESLERNDISRLPGGIFSRAFVRSYAQEVGLDAEEIIQAFIAQFPEDSVTAGHPHADRSEELDDFESERQAASSVLWIVLASLAVAGAVLYFTMGGRLSGPESKPIAATPPASRSQPVPVTPPASVPTTPTERPPTPTATLATERAPAPTDAAPRETAAPAATTNDVTPPPAAKPAVAESLAVALSARRPVWISATIDGQKSVGRLMQPGEEQSFQVKREMVLTAGDAGAVKMMLNGAEARSLGKAGEVVTTRVTLANAKDLLLTP